MKEENLAPDYNVFSGKPTKPVTHYGEIHTGKAWEPARNHYCGNNPNNMPIALIIFGDKSHFDLHGHLATTPISFTLSCFNEQARNKPNFGDQLVIFLTYPSAQTLEREKLIKDRPQIVSRTSKNVFLLPWDP